MNFSYADDQSNTLAAWNNLAGTNSTSVNNQVPDASFFDSSGNSMSGLDTGDMMKLAGSGLSAWGDILAGNEANQADQYNAQLAIEQGEFRISELDYEEASILSTQKAMYAKAGVTMSGSPLDAALNTASQVEMDKQITTYNAQSKANMDIYKGKVAESQGQVKAGEALLSGAATAFMELK